MDLLTPELRAALRANVDATRTGEGAHDPVPVLKLFNPSGGAAQGSGDAEHRWKGCGGAATWLANQLDADGDTLFGLADLGFGCPELGSFSLSEIAALRLPFGLGIERDLGFSSAVPLSVWAEAARREGSILGAEQALRRAEWQCGGQAHAPENPGDPAQPDPDPLPPSEPGGG